MSKAILVMDMPESCSKCKFIYEFQGTKKCHLMNVFNGGFSRISQNNFTVKRHEKCPLLQMPDKAYHIDFWDNGRYDKGWIACSERLPKYDEEYFEKHNNHRQYIVMCKDSYAPTVAYFSEEKTWYYDEFVKFNDVIAWQPLPEPYKEGEKE